MCMALADAGRPQPPQHPLRRIAQWLGFGLLLCRLLAAGLGQWLVHRLRNRAA